MPAFDAPLLLATLRHELRAAWHTLRTAHGQDDLYGFGLYTTASASYLMVTAFTQKGLEQAVAQQMAEFRPGGRADKLRKSALKMGGKPDDPDLARRSLRWSPCDSPLHEAGSGLLPESDKLVQALEERWADDDEMDDDEFEDACEAPDPELDEAFRIFVQVLQEMDGEGLFGAGAERERLVVSIWQGDQSNRSRHDFARQLNPPSVAARFGREMNDGTVAYYQAFYGDKHKPDIEAFE